MPSTLEKLDFVDVKSNGIMGCTESVRVCLRFTLVFLNIPFVIVGLVSVCVGIWFLASDRSLFDLTADILDLEILDQDILRQGAVVMVTAGAAILALAALGVLGALSMNSCLLVFYVVTLVVLLTLQASVIVLAVVFKSEWEARMHQVLTETIISQYGDDNDRMRGPFSRMLNTIQEKLDCCGWEGGWDYARVDRAHWNTTLDDGQHRLVPDSCCRSDNATWILDCLVSPYNSSSFSIMGCREAVEAELKHCQWLVIGVTISVLALQFVVLIVTLVLIVHNVSKKYSLS